MPRINILDRRTAELIAAGEVIERPASVVKELVENAVDSGAGAVTVEVQSGGTRYIRVTDNGCGITREDIPKAFLRHATSKVLTADDLGRIGTLGFRGEALASICAVGRVELLTRTGEEPIGSRYRISGGEGGEVEDAGCPPGTTVIVRDLFYNVPARMKFLKKDATEGNAVATLMDRLALSHPEVSFQLIREGQRKLHTPGDGKLLSAVYGVYGGDFGNSLIPVEDSGALSGARVTGFITKPEGAKATRGMEHFFINGRYVRSGTMLAALEESYKNALMAGRFPGCVLCLELPFEMVDVNVHPAKLEVKLSDEKLVFDAVYSACKSALSTLETGVQARDASRGYRDRVSWFELKNPPVSGEQQRMTARQYRKAASLDGGASASTPENGSDGAAAYRRSLSQQPGLSARETAAAPRPTPGPSERREAAGRTAPGPSEPPEMPEGRTAAPAEPEGGPLRLIGELFGTYILAQRDGEFCLIDKHAAHERLLFEELKAEFQKGDIPRQLLLTAVRVSLPKDRYGALLQNPQAVARAGFGVEDFGDGSVLVREIPAVLPIGQVEDAVLEMARMLAKSYTRLDLDFFDQLLHSVACKAAVKGNRFSERAEQQELLDRLAEHPEVRSCPHGRPVMIVMTQRELEKMFGRVL